MSSPVRLGTILRPDLAAAIVRFPVPVGASLVATVLLILGIADRIPLQESEFEWALLGALITFLGGVAGQIWLESRGRVVETILSQLAALALGLSTALALFDPWLDPFVLTDALAVLVVAAPGLSPGGTPIRFWVFNTRSVLAGVVGVVGIGAFALGFWAIVATLQSLFGLEQLSDHLSYYAVAVGFAFVLPLYWLACQPKVLEIEDEEPQPDLLWRTVAGLADFVAIPLLAIYAVILHAYAAGILYIYATKITVDAAPLHKQVGWMVAIFLQLGYLTFLLAWPQQSPLPGLRRLFRLLWPPATIVPVGLLALALWERIETYGLIEERYQIALGALAACFLFIAWLPRRQLDARLVPAVVAGLLVIGSVGPFSARWVTVRSQAQRFVAILEASGELQDGRFDGERSTPWPRETRDDLRFIIGLLDERGSLHLIAPAVGEELAADRQELTTRLGLSRSDEPR